MTAVQDLIARFTGSDRPKVSPTGSSTTRRRATEVRSAASTATDGVQETTGSAKAGVTSTAYSPAGTTAPKYADAHEDAVEAAKVVIDEILACRRALS